MPIRNDLPFIDENLISTKTEKNAKSAIVSDVFPLIRKSSGKNETFAVTVGN